MEQEGAVSVGDLPASDRDAIDQGIGELRERIQRLQSDVAVHAAGLERVERDVRAYAVSLGWVPSVND